MVTERKAIAPGGVTTSPTPIPDHCQHPRAYPSLDHQQGYFCPDCGSGCTIEHRTLSPSLLTETLSMLTETTPPPVPPLEESSVSSLISSVSSEESSVSTSGHGIKVCPSHGKRYFRYVAWHGHKITHSIHIPGGDTRNPTARERARLVKRAIDNGQSPTQIQQLIQTWRRQKPPTLTG